MGNDIITYADAIQMYRNFARGFISSNTIKDQLERYSATPEAYAVLAEFDTQYSMFGY